MGYFITIVSTKNKDFEYHYFEIVIFPLFSFRNLSLDKAKIAIWKLRYSDSVIVDSYANTIYKSSKIIIIII